MQTTLARRQRRRKALQRQPQGHAGTTFGQILLVVLVVFVLTTGLLAGAGALVAVSAYNNYAAGLPDPVAALTNIDFEQQTIIYDRTGKVELARLGDLKRELVTFDQLPGEIIDATTAIEDKDFWTNPGFDPIGIVSAGLDTSQGKARGASTITQQLVRARLLPPEAFDGSIYERKAREIIQSIRLTQALPPGDAGKQQIITAYLNQNFYGNQSYGVKAAAKSYFGKSLDRADPRPGRDPRRDPPVADQVRPRPQCRRGLPRQRRRGPGVHELQARRAPGLRDRPAAQPRPRPDEDAQPADRHQAHGGRVRGGQGRAGRAPPAGLGRLEGAPVRVAGPPSARPDVLPGHARTTAPRSTPAATRSSPRSTGTCRRSPRSGSTSRPARRTPRTRRRS